MDYSKSIARIQRGMAQQREMRKLRRDGWTLSKIADKYQLSKARVCQILGPSQRGAG